LSKTKLLIATTNRGKAAEFRKLLAGLPLEVLGPEALGSPPPECPEKGSSFCENAKIKAAHWSRYSGLATLADDSGLVVDALDGAPGIFSARFAGEQATDKENLEHLLDLLQGVEESARGASFICCLALCRPEGDLITFQGSCRGRILSKPQGRGGFGYDPVFYYPPLQRTFAQLSPEEKNVVSHRARALDKLRIWLQDHRL